MTTKISINDLEERVNKQQAEIDELKRIITGSSEILKTCDLFKQNSKLLESRINSLEKCCEINIINDNIIKSNNSKLDKLNQDSQILKDSIRIILTEMVRNTDMNNNSCRK